MRPPAIERMGYYPTDDPVVEIIQTYLKPPVIKRAVIRSLCRRR